MNPNHSQYCHCVCNDPTLEQRIAELVEKMENNPEAHGMFTLWLAELLVDIENNNHGS